MMSVDNDSLQPVRSISTGSNRATTPSKVAVRNTTPQRNSTPLRYGSANKERDLSKLASDVSVLNRHPSRSISHRKQRQWENKNLFGLELINKDGLVNEVLEKEEQIYHQRYAFKVDWRSKFAELFEHKNHNELESFRTCKDITSRGDTNVNQHLKHIRNDEWREAEIAWLNVEKRLRSVLFRSLLNSEQFRLYVEALEIVILSFLETETLPDHSIVPVALSNCLLNPMRMTSSGGIELSLNDSPFHRLLLHATCQFYGIKSKVHTKQYFYISSSVVDSVLLFLQSVQNKVHRKQKVTIMSRPRRISEVAVGKVSLVGFLHASIGRSATDGISSVVEIMDTSIAQEIEQLMQLSLEEQEGVSLDQVEVRVVDAEDK